MRQGSYGACGLGGLGAELMVRCSLGSSCGCACGPAAERTAGQREGQGDSTGRELHLSLRVEMELIFVAAGQRAWS